MRSTARRALALAVSALAVGAACTTGPPPLDAGRRDDAGPVDAYVPRPRWDAGPRVDAGLDASPCAELFECGTECVDLATDPAHCGACDVACDPPADASPTCAGGSCGFVCDPGFAEVDGACLPAPRPLWPPSLATVVSSTPVLKWALPDGLTDATVELCADPACGTVVETLSVTGTEAQPTAALAAGPVFWRVTADRRVGPTWQLRVRARSVDADRAWGVYPDYDLDGLGDVAVGAPRADDSEGRAYVFLGAPTGPSATPSQILRSPDGAGAEFGVALACAGDLDGDGYAELAVGAPRAGGTAGRVHLYYGGPAGIEATPRRSLDAPAGADSLFGGTLAGLGDVNGDGYGDLLVGALGEGITPGRAYLFLGGPTGPAASPDVTLTGSGRFASAIAGAGDVDGDGLADAVIGAQGASSSAGAAHLFLGSSDGLPTTPSRTYDGADGNGAQLGFAVAGIGDVNGDGYADFALSAPAANGSVGRVHVYQGEPAGPPAAPARSLDGMNAGGGFFGHALAGFGDGNGDGFDDLAIGAFGVDSRRGRVAVHLGGEGGLSTARTQIAGQGTEHDFGWSLAAAGDVEGNGRGDLVVGAPGADGRGGRAYVHRGSAMGAASDPYVTLIGPAGGAFGRAVATTHR